LYAVSIPVYSHSGDFTEFTAVHFPVATVIKTYLPNGLRKISSHGHCSELLFDW
jgi:hypothetical protein